MFETYQKQPNKNKKQIVQFSYGWLHAGARTKDADKNKKDFFKKQMNWYAFFWINLPSNIITNICFDFLQILPQNKRYDKKNKKNNFEDS